MFIKRIVAVLCLFSHLAYAGPCDWYLRKAKDYRKDAENLGKGAAASGAIIGSFCAGPAGSLLGMAFGGIAGSSIFAANAVQCRRTADEYERRYHRCLAEERRKAEHEIATRKIRNEYEDLLRQADLDDELRALSIPGGDPNDRPPRTTIWFRTSLLYKYGDALNLHKHSGDALNLHKHGNSSK